MKTVKVIESTGKLVRDPTSRGDQWAVEQIALEFQEVEEVLRDENTIVRIRIEIDVKK